jgi:hypothetical protein
MMEAMGSGESPGGQEHGNAGDGDAELLRQHPEKKDEVGVVYEKCEGDRHRGF